MASLTEFAMVHPALTLPGLWSVAQGRGARTRAVSGRHDGVRREHRLVPQVSLGLNVVGAIDGVTYQVQGPHRPSQTYLSYMLALIANARPGNNERRLRVDLAGDSAAAIHLRPRLPAPFHQGLLFGVETNYPNVIPAERVDKPETCSLEALMRDAGKSPDVHERAVFWRFVQTVSPLTLTVTKHLNGVPEVVGGIPMLMYRVSGHCMELWFNPLQSRVLDRTALFRIVSLVERNQLDGDAAKALRFVLSVRVQRAKLYTIRREELLALLYPDCASSPQEAYRRRLVVTDALAKIARLGWSIRDDGAKLSILRPKRRQNASDE